MGTVHVLYNVKSHAKYNVMSVALKQPEIIYWDP